MIGYLRTLSLFYRRHLRVQPLRELMAVVGVAAGVALLFAVQVNSHSITGSFEEVADGVAGHATLEVASRGPEGLPASVAEKVARIPGVRATAPLLSTQIVAIGPRGSQSLTLVGATEELAALGGKLARAFQSVSEASTRGLMLLTAPTAKAIGVGPGQTVTIRIGATTRHLTLDATMPVNRIGALEESPVAAAPLPIVQLLAGLPGRLTQILIEPRRGQQAALRRTLTARFGATFNVRSADSEARLLADAAAPEAQLSALFSALAVVVGIILAYNALLLASGERRRFIVYLIETGTPDSMIVSSLAFDAVILGLVGSVLGLLLGDLISILAFRTPPGYLRAAFPIGGQRIVDWQAVAIAFGAGMFAALAAAAMPAISVLRSGATAEPFAVGRALTLTRRLTIGRRTGFISGLLLAGVSVAASLLWPTVTTIGLVGLAAGVVLCLPTVVHYILEAGSAASRHTGDPSARLSAAELRSSPTRSVALVATGAVAVFLTVLIGGSVADVQSAVRIGATDLLSGANVWVRPGGAQNLFDTQPFAYGALQARLADVSAVQSVVPYHEAFLDLPDRRVWVIGVPAQVSPLISASQRARGSLPVAEAHLREGGWVVMSQAIGTVEGLPLGDRVTLPTPSGATTFRLAATIYNYGWPPGTVIINGDEYARLWHTANASQLAITLKAGVSGPAGRQAIQSALPAGSALSVQTTEERRSEISRVLGGTLSRLSQTTTIVLLGAIASVVAMMVAAVWQRRGRLDALISIGMSATQLARLVFYEGGLMLLGGCLIGLGTGVLAQDLIDRWARHATDSQLFFTPAVGLGLRAVALAVGISVVAAMIAVVRTVGFGPKAAFSTD